MSRVICARRVWKPAVCVGVASLVLMGATARAQEPIARRGKEPVMAGAPVERTLFGLEEEWTRALVRRDGARVIAAHDYLVPERR